MDGSWTNPPMGSLGERRRTQKSSPKEQRLSNQVSKIATLAHLVECPIDTCPKSSRLLQNRYPGGNSYHESYRAVNKSIEVRGGGDLFSTTRSKASQISSIMFMSGDLGGQCQCKCLKLEECSWSHLVATLDA
ncbi:hypothetical protein AVEN_132636-1 [Araneus ventricosus]|uniref:Uncharacterized protein n=1 Tax=Araneus ventricosus TaxID=182803 RepID=A0A4Y2AX29_ARAVE|nr:hypothetical protein AVEN_132636-1 [Araneus ventricosus]